METLCTALAAWLDSKPVPFQSLPTGHHSALMAQQKLGWNQVFRGHLSQSWEQLQGTTVICNGKFRQPYLWSARIITYILEQVILLWEIRNSEVHGANPQDKHQKLLEHQRMAISTLLSLKTRCLARDQVLFPADPKTLLQKNSTMELGNWIAAHKPAIHLSIKRAKEQDIQHTNIITKWFKPLKNTISGLLRWKRDRLRHDPYSKKKRHKQISTGFQTPLTRYLSLNSTFSNL